MSMEEIVILICFVLIYALAFCMGMYTANRGGKASIKTEKGKGSGHILPESEWSGFTKNGPAPHCKRPAPPQGPPNTKLDGSPL